MKHAQADYDPIQDPRSGPEQIPNNDEPVSSQLFGIELTLQTGCDEPLTVVVVKEWLEGIFRGCDVGDVRINRVFFKGRVEGSRGKTLEDHAAEQEAFPEAPLKRAALRAEEVIPIDELEEHAARQKIARAKCFERWQTFGTDLQDLLNRHSAENAIDTPDFLFASYLLECLGAFEHTFAARRSFYDKPDLEIRCQSCDVKAPHAEVFAARCCNIDPIAPWTCPSCLSESLEPETEDA